MTFDMNNYLAGWLAEEMARRPPPTGVDQAYTRASMEALIARWEAKQTASDELPAVLYALAQCQPQEPAPSPTIVLHLFRMLPIHGYILANPNADLSHNPGIARAAATLHRWDALNEGTITDYGRDLLAAWRDQHNQKPQTPAS